jgi:hypothetical protein
LEKQIDIWINRAESKWLNLLSSHAEHLFLRSFLPSHDHTHHHRVWNICKNLLKEISPLNGMLDEAQVEGILIAAWFHDLGMVQSTREDHGKLGKELCESWFREQGKKKPELFTEILNAIQWHDNKKDGAYSALHRNRRPGILSVLCIADDLEAMGTIGVYRYAEIYLKREIKLSELGSRILENAEVRYENLTQNCSLCETLMRNSQIHYQILQNFYQEYNTQLLLELNPEHVYAGPLGVINYIRTLGMEEKIRPEYLSKHIAQEDTTVKSFFKTLSNELDQARQ